MGMHTATCLTHNKLFMPKTIDFTKFKMFTDISQEETVTSNQRIEFSDVIYKNVPGIAAHELAMRIYKSDGPMELSDADLNILLPFVEQAFVPVFVDSFKSNLIEKQ